jgi:hypothetical protein
MRMPTLGDSLRIVQLEHKISDEVAAEIKSRHLWLDHTYYDAKLLITGPSTVLTPNGDVLFHLIKGHIDPQMLAAARPSLLKVAANRVIGGQRGSSAGGLEPAYRADGSLSKQMRVPHHENLVAAKDGVFGFYDRTVHQRYCRSTAFTRNHIDHYARLLPYLQKIDTIYRDYAPDKYRAQQEFVETTHKDWLIPDTIASTATVNFNYPTTAHTDSGDCRVGLGIVTTCCSGTFYGGALCFPEYRCAVQISSGDVLLANVHALHGNLPIVGDPKRYERISTILYAREKIAACGTLAEEQALYEEAQWKASRKSAVAA